jgi:hypothetical protein
MPDHRRALPLIACMALAVPALGAETSFDGTYAGERVLTKGDPASCVAKDTVSIVIHGDELTFTNSRVKNYTISLSPRADGSFDDLSTDISGVVVAIRGRVGGGRAGCRCRQRLLHKSLAPRETALRPGSASPIDAGPPFSQPAA